MDIKTGNNLTLSSITTTLHVGAHADAPSHFDPDGEAIDEVDLSPYMGPCLVLDIKIEPGNLITPEHLVSFPKKSSPEYWGFNGSKDKKVTRLLCKTGSYKNFHNFNEDFVAFHPSAVDFLGREGVKLVGIDTPSVDEFSSKSMPSHQAFYRYGMRNLEGLDLSHVPEGLYELIALPLRLEGCDGSPVRAILRQYSV